MLMKDKLEKALEECLARLKEGEDIETCLAAYPDLRGQLERLLSMASALTALPKVSPSDEYRKLSQARLLARLREQAARTEKPERAVSPAGLPAGAWYDLRWWFSQPVRVTISVTLALIIALTGTLFSQGPINLFSPSPALASPCTLRASPIISRTLSRGFSEA